MKSRIIEGWETGFNDGKAPMSRGEIMFMTCGFFGFIGLVLYGIAGFLYHEILNPSPWNWSLWFAPIGVYIALVPYVFGLAELAVKGTWKAAEWLFVKCIGRFIGITKESVARKRMQKLTRKLDAKFENLWSGNLGECGEKEPFFVGSGCNVDAQTIKDVCEENFRDLLDVKSLPLDTSVTILFTEKIGEDDYLVISRLSRRRSDQHGDGTRRDSFECVNAGFRLQRVQDPKGDVITPYLLMGFPRDAMQKQMITVCRDIITRQVQNLKTIESAYDDPPRPLEDIMAAKAKAASSRIAAT